MKVYFDISGLQKKDVSDLEKANESIDRLEARKKSEIKVVGQFAQSKLAWKIAVYQQSILYRMIMLWRGSALAWNNGNSLASVLSARALVETVAVIADIEFQLSTFLQEGNLTAIDALVMNRTFATRDTEFLKVSPESGSTNVMTLVDKLDKRMLPGVRSHYDHLCEWCHPNSLGHHQLFTRINKTTGTVTFSDKERSNQVLIHIKPAVSLLDIAGNIFDGIDEAIIATSELQNRINPVE